MDIKLNLKHYTKFFSKTSIVLGLYLLLTVFFSVINYDKGNTKYFSPSDRYTHYNNYIIFKNAYINLKADKNLYIHYPNLQWDLYKYSPSFAAAMYLLAIFSDQIGLIIWNLINVLVLFFGIRYFVKGPPHTIFMLWFVLNEWVTSVINSQSNPMIAGLLVAAFVFFEKDKVHWAALCIIATFYIKVFGILACLLFLFYPNKLKFIAWCLFWAIVIFIIPMLFTSPQTLIWQYSNWLELLKNDHSNSYGYSFMGVLNTWFGINKGKDLLVQFGLINLVLPFIFYNQFKNLAYRTNWFIALLIWLVIFNHKAESPTFIIGFTGIAIWLFTNPTNKLVIALSIFAFVFTSLAPTDLFPVTLRQNVFEPYAIKALPCILIWLYLTFWMYKAGFSESNKKLF